ncbi:MAG TPA: 4Fe-4S dicluster domain-containing protein [Thiotrichales bacterium]|nr:4Fe-4S dicluster domain-containing protein [Thiotrichales bacterium]
MSDPKKETMDQGRRRFLGAGAAAAATIAPGVTLMQVASAKPDDQPVSDKNRWGLLIDTTKCASGCDACVQACNEEFNLQPQHGPRTDPHWIRKVEVRDTATGRTFSLPMMCQHCENPPCADVCPTGASFRRDDGIVLVDRHICIGCRYCMMACPYKARSFVHEEIPEEDKNVNAPRGKGCVEACTLCVHRVDKGRQPACVEACNGDGHKAMIFGDLKDPGSEISRELKKYPSTQIRADLRLNPGVFYKGI